MAKHRIIAEDLEAIISADLPFDEMAGKTVLISGAAGLIPGYLTETLLFLNERRNLKIKVIGVVRNEKAAVARFSRHIGRAALKLVVHDISRPREFPGPIDYIIHAASQASPRFYGSDPVGTLLPNILGTYQLLELARLKKTRSFLYFSSCEVYGSVDSGRIPTKETDLGCIDPMTVRSCYAESKRMGETMSVAWQHQHNVPVLIVRPYHTYGPGMSLEDGRVFGDFVADIVNRRDITVKSDGRALRPYCYLADAISGFFTVLLKGIPGEAYNVGNDQTEISVIELANRLAALFPEENLKVIHAPDSGAREGYLKSEVSRYCPDTSKIRLLGWEPRHDIESGFKRTIQSFQ